jgi:hypothetical protein
MFLSNWDEPIKNKLVYKEEQDRKEKEKKKKNELSKTSKIIE